MYFSLCCLLFLASCGFSGVQSSAALDYSRDDYEMRSLAVLPKAVALAPSKGYHLQMMREATLGWGWLHSITIHFFFITITITLGSRRCRCYKRAGHLRAETVAQIEENIQKAKNLVNKLNDNVKKLA